MALGLLKKRKQQGNGAEGIFNSQKEEAKTILKNKQKTEELVGKVWKLCNKLSNLPIIGEGFADVPWVCMLISDYVNGFYKEIPLATVITLTSAILYLVSPVDILPDALPLVGQLDDLVIIGLAFKAAQNDLNSYKEWKINEG